MIKDKYECIIVGGGIGGCVMASMLALYGVDVLLVEKNSWLGGCVTDYKIKDYICSHTIDWFSGVHEKGKIHYWFSKLDILDKISFQSLPSFKRVITQERNICFYSDFERFKNELINSFPLEEEGITRLIDFVMSFGGSEWANYFRPYRNKEFLSILEDLFKEPEIKIILSANLNDDMSAFLYVLFLFRCLSKEIYLPKDKTLKEVFSIIEERMTELGVTILKNLAVSSIGVEGNNVSSVRLGDGRLIKADGIITDTDLAHVYNSLLPHGSVNDYFMKKLRSKETSISLITTFVGVNKEFNSVSLYGEPVVYVPSYLLEDKYAGEAEKWHLKINIRSVLQPFLCTPGKSAVDIRAFLPQKAMGDNYDRNSYRHNERYKQDKSKLEQQLIATSQNVLGNYISEIEVKKTATPYTFERYTNATNGSAMGWAIAPIEYTNGFRIVSPLSNLFHVGCWASFPGIEGVVNYCFSILPRIVRFYGKV